MAQIQSSNVVAERDGRADNPQRTGTDLASLDRSRLRGTPGLYRRAWQRFRRNRIAVASLVVFIAIVIFVAGADLVSRLTGFSYSENHLDARLTPPFTDGYVLGADGNGRDILTRLAYGGRASLMIAFLGTLSTMAIGVSLGLIAGYAGGFVDNLLMRAVDVMSSIPGLPLLILISTLYQPNPAELAIILALTGWPGITRIVRGEVLSQRKRDYVDAARTVGVPPRVILFRHILPNITPIAIVWASLIIPALILTEAGLSYLGLGVQVPTPSWGNMLQEATRFYRTAWSNVFIPGLILYVTSLTLYLIGSALRDALDPRLAD